MLDIGFDPRGVHHLEKLTDNFPRAIRAGVREVAGVAERQEDKQIARIYAASIPSGKNGEPLWTRSGDLQRGRTTTFPTRDSVKLSFTGKAGQPIKNWPGGYAQRREALGVSWTPRNPAGGRVRKQPFATRTVQIITPQIKDVFEQAVRNHLGLRG